MKTKRSKTKSTLSKRKEKIGWKKHNAEADAVTMSPEQCLEWLDGVRSFMFEVWKRNPDLRKAYEKAKLLGF